MQFTSFISAALAATFVQVASASPDIISSYITGDGNIIGSAISGNGIIGGGITGNGINSGNIVGTDTGAIISPGHNTEIDVQGGTTKVVADGTTIINGQTVGASPSASATAPGSASAGSAASSSNSGNAAPAMTRGPSIELAMAVIAGGVVAAL